MHLALDPGTLSRQRALHLRKLQQNHHERTDNLHSWR